MSKKTNKLTPEVRERAVRMVFDHERDHPSRWVAVVSISGTLRSHSNDAAHRRNLRLIRPDFNVSVRSDPPCG